MALTTSGLKKGKGTRKTARPKIIGGGGKSAGTAKKGPGTNKGAMPKAVGGGSAAGTMGKGKAPGHGSGSTAGSARGSTRTRPVLGGVRGKGSKISKVSKVYTPKKPGAGAGDHAYNVKQRKKTAARIATARGKTKAHLASLRKKKASPATIAKARQKAKARYAKIKGQSKRRRTVA